MIDRGELMMLLAQRSFKKDMTYGQRADAILHLDQPDPNEPYWNARQEQERDKLRAIWNLCTEREEQAEASLSRMFDGKPFPAVVTVSELKAILTGREAAA